MNTCVLVIKEDSTNAINKKITKFLHDNMDDLIYSHHIIIQYERLSGGKKYKDINKCPTLIVGKKRLEGNDILSFLKNPSRSDKPHKHKRPPPASDIESYYDNIMTDTSDMTDTRDKPPDRSEQLQTYIKDRGVTETKSARIPGKYDKVCAELNGAPPQLDDMPRDEEYADDFGRNDMSIDNDIPPIDDFHSYAMQNF